MMSKPFASAGKWLTHHEHVTPFGKEFYTASSGMEWQQKCKH